MPLKQTFFDKHTSLLEKVLTSKVDRDIINVWIHTKTVCIVWNERRRMHMNKKKLIYKERRIMRCCVASDRMWQMRIDEIGFHHTQIVRFSILFDFVTSLRFDQGTSGICLFINNCCHIRFGHQHLLPTWLPRMVWYTVHARLGVILSARMILSMQFVYIVKFLG